MTQNEQADDMSAKRSDPRHATETAGPMPWRDVANHCGVFLLGMAALFGGLFVLLWLLSLPAQLQP